MIGVRCGGGPLKSWTPWIKYVLAAAFLAVVGVRLAIGLTRDEPINLYPLLERERFADMEAAAAIKANADAKAAFDAAMATCGPAPDITCRARIYGATQDAALKALLDGGCLAWELSEWDPSRGQPGRAPPKDDYFAKIECEVQARGIADRVTQSLR